MLGAGALGLPRGMVWGGRKEECSGWGTHVYLWRIHFNVWQNQYHIVKFKNKIKFKKMLKKKKKTPIGAGALGRPRGMVKGGRREEGSVWGTRVYLWWIHVDIWPNQYNIVKLKNKIK